MRKRFLFDDVILLCDYPSHGHNFNITDPSLLVDSQQRKSHQCGVLVVSLMLTRMHFWTYSSVGGEMRRFNAQVTLVRFDWKWFYRTVTAVTNLEICFWNKLRKWDSLENILIISRYFIIALLLQTFFHHILKETVLRTIFIAYDKVDKLDWTAILGMDSANERRHCNVKSSLIGWAHIQNDP